MQELTITQKFFRYFAFIHIWLAGGMILGGLSLRFFTGYHTSGFAFFAFGLACLYMAIVSGYVYQNWFLQGEDSPVYERSQRKALLMGWSLGVPFWGVFGAIVILPVFDDVLVQEYKIVKTLQFDREVQRFVAEADRDGNNGLKEYTDSILVVEGDVAGLTVPLDMVWSAVGENTHIQKVLINDVEYKLVLMSHLSHFGWDDFNKHYSSNPEFCHFIVPFVLYSLKGERLTNNVSSSKKIKFMDHEGLNEIDITLGDGELIVNNILERGNVNRARSCKIAASEYFEKKSTPSGYDVFRFESKELLNYLAYPGLSQGKVKGISYKKYVLVGSPYIYIRRVGEAFRGVFD